MCKERVRPGAPQLWRSVENLPPQVPLAACKTLPAIDYYVENMSCLTPPPLSKPPL